MRPTRTTRIPPTRDPDRVGPSSHNGHHREFQTSLLHDLTPPGHLLRPKTDTEVIAPLVDGRSAEMPHADFEGGRRRAARWASMRAAFALAPFLFRGEEKPAGGAPRRGSPLRGRHYCRRRDVSSASDALYPRSLPFTDFHQLLDDCRLGVVCGATARRCTDATAHRPWVSAAVAKIQFLGASGRQVNDRQFQCEGDPTKSAA